MSSKKRNIYLSSFFIIIYVSTYIISFWIGKPISIYSFLTAIAVLPLVTLVCFKLPKWLYFPIILFVVFSNYFAMMLNFYEIIPIFDLLLHFVSGTLLFIIGYYIYDKLTKNQKHTGVLLLLPILFSFCFSITGAAVWEIYEFTADSLFGLTTQKGSLIDTMGDVIAGTIGALIGVVGLYILYKVKQKKNKIVD